DADRDGGSAAEKRGGQRGSGGKGGDVPEIRGGESDAPFLLPPDLLKEQFLGAAENNPLLDTLNRLPGRNGQCWLVLPLSFDENGIQYRITLKLLLDGETAGGGCSVRRMSLEITERTLGGQRGADKRRLFIMDRDSLRRGEQVDYRLTLLLDPPRGQSGLKSLAGKLSRFMEMPADRITVKNYGDSLFAPDSRNIVLQSVNKEV
ncbi:MAG TPA: hypothetical protein DEQ14_11485, partial [Treponema sp.]|nr:hypothetical protein [Treponema sp.]